MARLNVRCLSVQYYYMSKLNVRCLSVQYYYSQLCLIKGISGSILITYYSYIKVDVSEECLLIYTQAIYIILTPLLK